MLVEASRAANPPAFPPTALKRLRELGAKV